MLTPAGHAKVMDFGLAKQVAAAGALESAADTVTALTEAGSTLGTLAYMSPEQLRGQAVDGRSDLWALGVTLYEMVSGARPFQGQSGVDTTAAILHQAPRPLPSAVPAKLAAVIARCLEKDPAKRYQQAGELRAALSAVQAGTVSPWAGWQYWLTRRRWPIVAAAALLVAIVAALALALDVRGVRSRVVGGAAAPARVVRLAVLPFANVSGDAGQEYLSDGLTTEMTALLGRLHPETLRVIARTTAMRYKKTDKAIDQIGRELGVDYVLEGSAQREAGRIRITADLIKVADQTQLWAERYERELAGILVLQNDVAQQVAKALALKLLPAEQARLAGAKTVDPEVYDLCLKGLYYTERLSKADLDTAERYFQLALAKDRASAVAHAGMAMVWACRQQMGITPARESGPKAKAAVLEAVRLDDTLSKAHSTLGSILAWTDFNFPEAAREYRRSIELDPNDTNARAAYSLVLMILQRPDEAMPQIERAVAIDPLNAFNLSFYAFDLICARRYDEALSQARAALRVQPDAPAATSALILALHLKNLHDEAIATAAATYAGSLMGWPDVAEALKKGYAESGYAAALRRAAELETAKYGDLPGVAIDAANNYAMAGDRPRTLDWLEKAYEQRDPNMPYIGCMPIFDALRSEPCFKALLRQMQLPE
jgi:TolB-like protein/Tfp pilus assembly protein PilF